MPAVNFVASDWCGDLRGDPMTENPAIQSVCLPSRGEVRTQTVPGEVM